MNEQAEEGYVRTSLISFIVGSVIGAGLALLFAPQSGEHTRREIREKAERRIIKMQRMEDELKRTVSTFLHRIKVKVNQMLDDGVDHLSFKKHQMVDVIVRAKHALDEVKSQLDKAK